MTALSPDWIDAHNAKVKAFWEKNTPLIKAMTDDQCRHVLEIERTEGLSMNRIAERMQTELGGDWGAHVTVGIDIYREALIRFDEYDAEFRPRPEKQLMMQDEHGISVFYHTGDHEFEVVVGERSERFKATHRPIFGMDIADIQAAESIAQTLESQEGLNP